MQCGAATCLPDQNCINGVCQDSMVDVSLNTQNSDLSNTNTPSQNILFSMPLDDASTPNLTS